MKSGAVEALVGVPPKPRRRLIARIRKLAADPVSVGSESLSGAAKYRIRHEEFRVVYSVDREAMRVVVAGIGLRVRRPIS